MLLEEVFEVSKIAKGWSKLIKVLLELWIRNIDVVKGVSDRN